MQSISSLLADKKETVKKPYPFIKKLDQFENIQAYEFLLAKDNKDNKVIEPHHTAKTMTKKPKASASANYNKNKWFQVSNSYVDEKCADRMNRMIVLTGELFRLLDCHQTKYRIIQHADKQYPLSKGIKGGKDFCDYFNEKISPDFKLLPSLKGWSYSGNNFLQGMGRGFMGKYFYVENDLNVGNVLIDETDYVQIIDHDQCFWGWSYALHEDRISCKIADPVVTPRDYAVFPVLQDYKPRHWIARDEGSLSYFTKLSEQPCFLNEKFFATIKLLVTKEMQKYLLQHHIEDEFDKNKLLEILNSRFQSFVNACKESPSFECYFRDYLLDIMRAILFEFYDFFKNNKKYAEEGAKWSHHVDQMINHYSMLMDLVLKSPLSLSNKTDLKNYATILFSTTVDAKSKAEAIAQVEKFYISQKMTSFATLAKKQQEVLLKSVTPATDEKSQVAKPMLSK